MFLGLIQISQISPSQSEIKFRFRQRRIALIANSYLRIASSTRPHFVQDFAVVELRLGILRENFRHLCRSLDRRHHATDELSGAEGAKWNHQGRPSQAVPNPGRPTTRRYRRSSSRPMRREFIREEAPFTAA